VSNLIDPAAHEPLTAQRWNQTTARAAIAAIVADAEAGYGSDGLWPVHPLDDDDDVPLAPGIGLYLGASGMIWGLDALAQSGLAGLRREWTAVAAALPDRYVATPDLPEWTDGKPVPSLLAGESGVLLAAHRLAPGGWQVDRMVECVTTNARHPSRELMWGSPGTMVAARLLHERTGDARLADAWRACAEWLIEEWRDPVWEQDLYGNHWQFVGPGHGFAGNVLALTAGDLLDAGARVEVEDRAVAVLTQLAQREGDMAQWWPTLETPPDPTRRRTQWCHGAPGMVTSFAHIRPDDAALTELLAAGGELTWQAGPLSKGPSLCHGTAGNGYAFLKLHARTGDELWLDRARAFAMHAAGQVARLRAEHGRGRYTLWTGDIGVAVYLAACLEDSAAFPTLDVI
jgi:hypothetical protein